METDMLEHVRDKTFPERALVEPQGMFPKSFQSSDRLMSHNIGAVTKEREHLHGLILF